MRKEKRIILLFLIILSITISSFAMTGEVIVSATRIREEASTSSEIVDTIYQEDKVEITGDNGDWYQVSFNGKDGFIKKDFLKVTNEEQAKPVEEVTNQNATNNTETPQSNTLIAPTNNNETINNGSVQREKIVLTNDIELRNAPSLISQKYTTVKAGVQIEKLYEIGNWFQVTDGVHIGWVTEQRIQHSLITDNNAPATEGVNDNKEVKTEEKPQTATEEKKEEQETVLNKKGIVIVETANVRERATKDSDVIDALDENDIVIIQAEEGDWYKIVKGSISGYVNKRLIDTNNVTSRSLTSSRMNEENSSM